MEVKIVSLFSGIGGFELGFDEACIPYELINFSEIEEYAIEAYCAIHRVSKEKNLGDVSVIKDKELPKAFDLLTYGFPCQDLSTSGKGLGIVKGKTRSGLLYEALRLISVSRPKVAIAENVKNLVSKRHIKDFESMLEELEGMGYNNYWYILDSKDYGLAQVRERVFVVSILKELDEGMPKEIEKKGTRVRLKDFLETESREKYILKTYKSDGYRELESKDSYTGKAMRLGGLYDKEGKKRQAGSIWCKEGLAPTIGTCQGGNTEPLVLEGGNIRRLSPKEVWGLQGFSGERYELAKAALEKKYYRGADRSDSRMYKMGGNSISIPVIAAIYKEVYKNKKLMSEG